MQRTRQYAAKSKSRQDNAAANVSLHLRQLKRRCNAPEQMNTACHCQEAQGLDTIYLNNFLLQSRNLPVE